MSPHILVDRSTGEGHVFGPQTVEERSSSPQSHPADSAAHILCFQAAVSSWEAEYCCLLGTREEVEGVLLGLVVKMFAGEVGSPPVFDEGPRLLECQDWWATSSMWG